LLQPVLFDLLVNMRPVVRSIVARVGLALSSRVERDRLCTFGTYAAGDRGGFNRQQIAAMQVDGGEKLSEDVSLNLARG
jgi:hypothetical protein